jgi:hypothetical protein
MKSYQSILLACSDNDIYWREALPWYENEHDNLRKIPGRFYLYWVVMAFIKWKLFHVKKTNLTFYERRSFHFIVTEFWWHWMKGSSSTTKDRTWPFTKSSQSIFVERRSDAFIEEENFQDKRRNLSIYEKLSVDFIEIESWWLLLNESSFTLREVTWQLTKIY